jgi:DNA-binding CsgD family transcriptional regulator
LTVKPRAASRDAVLLGQWSKGLAEMGEALGKESFPAVLLQAVRRLVDVDFVMTFAYRSGSRPIAIGDTLQAKPRQIIIQRYLDGPYMLDPFFQAVNAGTKRGCFRVHDLAPDRFRQSEYFRAHYRLTGIGEEVGFFFALPGEVTGVMSLARWVGSPKLTRQDLSLLAAIEPAIGSLCALNWAEAGRGMARPNSRERSPQSAQLSRAYEQFGSRLLSERERQVAGLVLQGHSSESIARHLDISPGTVKIHRRNCYRKLGISTQAELFAAFLGALG